METITALHYSIRIEPDLESFLFSGSADILLETGSPSDRISLHALDLAIRRVVVKRGNTPARCLFEVRPRNEELTILLPEPLVGRIQLIIDYRGEINERMMGFYRSRYRSAGQERYLATTQFQESDARRAFPCLDHPLHKATFDLELVIPQHLSAISNGPIVSESSLGNGKKLVRFARTPPMSTYLLFFGVGEFEFLSDPGMVTLRVATLPGLASYGRYGLEFGRKALGYCIDYFAIPFPFSKLDFIAVPDFAAGAMENWGAITFRENLLLYLPGSTSRAGEERICEVIAHEIVHQWFGNLVSPAQWRYLWLNESFATSFGHRIVAHFHPDWEVDRQFLLVETAPALERDALLETIPIELPGGEHVGINVSTAPIIYHKGGSIVRHIEGYLGAAVFQEGLRRYLARHSYRCATSPDLWQALEEVAKQPVSAIMKSWIEQPGYPLLEAQREGDSLLISQRRFTYLPSTGDQHWLIPVTVRTVSPTGTSNEVRILMTDKTLCLPLPTGTIACKVNAGQSGFYRVKYDAPSLLALGRLVRSKALTPEDRWGLQNDFYALVKRGDYTLSDYLEFLTCYADEASYLPLSGIANNLFHAYVVLEQAGRKRIAQVGKAFLQRVLAGTGYEPRQGEPPARALLRDQVLLHAVLYGDEEAERFARSAFTGLQEGKPVHPDVMRSVLQIAASKGDLGVLHWLRARLLDTDSEHERLNILAAFGSFRERSLIETVQHMVLTEVPARNKYLPITSLAANPDAIPLLWEWYLACLDQFEQFHPVHYERVIAALVPVCGLGREEEVAAFFQEYGKKTDKAKEVIRLSLERLRVNARLRDNL